MEIQICEHVTCSQESQERVVGEVKQNNADPEKPNAFKGSFEVKVAFVELILANEEKPKHNF